MAHIIRTAVVMSACFLATRVAAARLPISSRLPTAESETDPLPTPESDSALSSRCRLRIYKGARDYGPLGNLIARLFDKSPSNQTSKAATPKAERIHNYGPLGNLISWMFEKAPSEAPAPDVPSAPTIKASLLPITGGNSVVKQPPQQGGDYGLLGNVLVRFLDKMFGTPKSAKLPETVPVAPPSATKAEQVPQSKAPSEPERKPNKSLQSVRELLKLLVSNFLQDPTFDRAAEALKQREKGLGIDLEAGHGGYLTPAERERLLLHAEKASSSFPSQQGQPIVHRPLAGV